MNTPHRSGLKRTATGGALAATIMAGSMCGVALGEVRSSTQVQTYSVGGTTAASLVSYMRSNPFHGSKGDAVANIRPNYGLNVSSQQSGSVCRASRVTLNIRFVMTLPQARSVAGMASSTLSAWNSFVAFTKRHEETHKSIYIKCGNDFVAKAERLTAATCDALEAAVRRLFETEKAVCESRQRAFDRTDYKRVGGLALFAMARGSSRASR